MSKENVLGSFMTKMQGILLLRKKTGIAAQGLLTAFWT